MPIKLTPTTRGGKKGLKKLILKKEKRKKGKRKGGEKEKRGEKKRKTPQNCKSPT